MLVSPCRICHLTQGGELSIMIAIMSERSINERSLIIAIIIDDSPPCVK